MGHRQPTVDALAAGKHVLLEKPMAANIEDARAIMQAWEEHSDRILMVGFQMTTNPTYYTTKFGDPVFWPVVFIVIVLYFAGWLMVNRIINFKY